ncbi:hypothetical protein [Paracoccus homiensis]|uniref:Group 4 capsule polysaccharide lipoprotein gfcB, YjbF n=1 Tax=Paracoccus homiensis TaxID=364199 RepID=A0A1I0GCC5_9RHOB|nr:hypothetical protein [Paracoccus homiensis]SET68462.1 hypothetical protein SAMN04489858_10859 [Paracoccus homiensis]
MSPLRHHLVPLCLSLTAGQAAADGLTPQEAAVLPRVLQAVTVEISADHIGEERAILVAGDPADAGGADLVILASSPDEAAGQPIAIGRNLVWMGSMAGQIPTLTVSATGSLQLRAEQIGVGRSPWEEVLTFAERDGQIRVAGYTLRQWDRLTAASASCDWNLLTGRWVRDIEYPDRAASHDSGIQPALRLLADWDSGQDGWPDFCAVDLTQD